MDEVEIVGLFDSEETAAQVAKALNAWFNWVMEGEKDDIPEFFEDLGISTEDYAFESEDTDWEVGSSDEIERESGKFVALAVNIFYRGDNNTRAR